MLVGELRIQYIQSEEHITDIFMKALSLNKFYPFRNKLKVTERTLKLGGGC